MVAPEENNQDGYHKDGPIIEWDQEQWWREGKSRVVKDSSFFSSTRGKLIMVFGFIILIIVVLLIVLLDQPQTVVTDPQVDQEASIDQGLTPLQQQIKQLRRQLEVADPAIKDTPLPQVEMNITIQDE
ncbi:MAG: hypothetical protein XD95_0045 [Microgenomates bacterium 39_7]|nr:MAG: hypothetical protein XD95_0045 [Microgenomates bacterium 39_7]